MNNYGAMAMRHWARWLPTRFSKTPDPVTFFADLGEHISDEIQVLEDVLAGDDRPGEGYLEKVGRLNMARLNAESQVLRELALVDPEPEAKDVNEAEPAAEVDEGNPP